MMNEQQVQRFEQALERVGGEQETLSMLAGMAAEDAPVMLRALDQAVDAGDAASYAKTAHALKGLLSTFEINEPVSEIQPIIDAARDNDTSEVARLHARLVPKLRRLIIEVDEIS